MTAADPSDGTNEDRLTQVINAKFEAGFLKPYNYVNGYSRLQKYMDSKYVMCSCEMSLRDVCRILNIDDSKHHCMDLLLISMSNISRQRILNVMGTFRPAFRTVAQSLTDIDLVLVEEAFERLLLVSAILLLVPWYDSLTCVFVLATKLTGLWISTSL